MSQINHDNFVDWCENHFDQVKISGNQLQINSIFVDDNKFKLYCNTELNAFHCFKSEISGNLFKLVQTVEDCSYEDAQEILGGTNAYSLDKKIEEFFKNRKTIISTVHIKGDSEFNVVPVDNSIKLPDHTYPIKEMYSENPLKKKAEKYLNNRKIDVGHLMLCCAGKCANRIVIPYYDKDGILVYWNARTIDNNYVKYIFPENVKKVVYFPKHMNKDTVYVCEGEMNSMVLSQAGFFSCATGGKELPDGHRQTLKDYNIVMCYDNDIAGKKSLWKVATILKEDNAYRSISYVLPESNDWNDDLIKYDLNFIKNRIENNVKSFDPIMFKNLYYKDFS